MNCPLSLSKVLNLDFFMSILCPKFVIPSRYTIERYIYQLYSDEKIVLEEYLKMTSYYICLTTDAWTSF